MDTVTYPNEKVASYITTHFIPVKINLMENPEPGEEYRANWTPTVAVMDADKVEHHRYVGYLPPDDFLGQMALARAKGAFNQKHFPDAAGLFQEVAEKYPKTSAAPEAQYYLGVSELKAGSLDKLRAAWEGLMQSYPESDWAVKASFAFEK